MKPLFRKLVVSVLTWEARAVLKKYHPKIIAVTGSVGKTSTKDAIYATVKDFVSARKSEKSYNTEIGLPLTILNAANPWLSVFGWLETLAHGLNQFLLARAYPEWLVLEMGADRPNDIKNSVTLAPPDIAVVTGMGTIPVHVEFFTSPEALAKEKSNLVRGTKRGGTVLLNADSPRALAMREASHERVLTFGFAEGADIRASNYHITREGDHPTGITFKVDYDGSSVPIRISGGISTGVVSSALAAIGVGQTIGMNLITIADALGRWDTAPGRLKLIAGIKQTTILDDTYNASPAAVEVALEALAASREPSGPGRTVAVLGDMMELGKFTKEAHEAAGVAVVGKADVLITVGQRAHYFADGARQAGMTDEKIVELTDAREAGKYLQSFIEPGDTILIKGSQSMRLERTVEEIMREPERKKDLLVRQDAGWLER